MTIERVSFKIQKVIDNGAHIQADPWSLAPFCLHKLLYVVIAHDAVLIHFQVHGQSLYKDQLQETWQSSNTTNKERLVWAEMQVF